MTELTAEETCEREKLVDQLKIDLQERWRGANLDRVFDGLDIWCRRATARPFPGQRAYGFYLPGLPDKPWVDPNELAFAPKLKSKYEQIRCEAMQLIDGRISAPPYGVSDDAPADTPTTGWLEWRLAVRGRFVERRCERFPITTGIIAEIASSTPYLMNAIFMILKPSSALKLHADFNNMFVNLWLGIEAPLNCGLEVAGVTRRPAPGEMLAFNHSYEHVSWNNGATDRIVFSISVLHPDLSDDERVIAAFIIPQLEGHVKRFAMLR